MHAETAELPLTGTLQDLIIRSKGGKVSVINGDPKEERRRTLELANAVPTPNFREIEHLLPVKLDPEKPGMIFPEPQQPAKGKRGRKPKSQPHLQGQPVEQARPMTTITYRVELAAGGTIPIVEHAHSLAITSENIGVLFPMSATRLKPEAQSTILIEIGGRLYKCWSPGIHTDFPQMGLSYSAYLIIPEQEGEDEGDEEEY